MNTVARIVRPLDRPRPFTAAEKALIRRVHGYMPAAQLLEVLNERLAIDVGRDVPKHTMEQLHEEIGELQEGAPAGGNDWASLRKVISKAQRAGTLSLITRQLIDDFAVIFALSPAQVLRLQDVLLRAKEGGES